MPESSFFPLSPTREFFSRRNLIRPAAVDKTRQSIQNIRKIENKLIANFSELKSPRGDKIPFLKLREFYFNREINSSSSWEGNRNLRHKSRLHIGA